MSNASTENMRDGSGCNTPRGGFWRKGMKDAPTDRVLLGWVDGKVRCISWGKTSHVPMYGWCLADQGIEDYDLCKPTHWMEMPKGPK
jgi:hypothetical protein